MLLVPLSCSGSWYSVNTGKRSECYVHSPNSPRKWELTSGSVSSGLSFWAVWSLGDSKLIHRECRGSRGPELTEGS